MGPEQEPVALPDYYEAVVKGAKKITGGGALNLCSDGEHFNDYEIPKPQTTEDRTVRLLDKQGQITNDFRKAAAVLLDSGAIGCSAVFFKERFIQPLPPLCGQAQPTRKDYGRSFCDLPENAPQYPRRMSDWQAHELATNPATYIDAHGRFHMG